MDSARLPAVATLCLLLLLAVWRDLKSRRIPNALVLTGMLLGLALQALAPSSGLTGAHSAASGLLGALAGGALGLLLLLPCYALRVLGAGDVKLMAMVGVWLGPGGVLGALLLTFLAGGALAVLVALHAGMLARVLANVREMMQRLLISGMSGEGAAVPAAPVPTGKLPYAVAIACGTVGQLLLADVRAWTMFS